MSTATDLSVDELELILLDDSASNAPCCDRVHPTPCDREAVYLTIWSGDEASGDPCLEHTGRKGLLCLPCFEHWTQPDGLIYCAPCNRSGATKFIKIVWSEPIRRSM